MDASRKLIKGSLATTYVAIAIAIAVMANLVASQIFWRVDLTQDQIYTLSEASAQAVATLDEPVTVKVFVSPEMPPPFHTLPERVSDLLTEYEAASQGELTFQIITPSDDDEQAQEAAAGYGCEKVAIGQRSEDEVSLRAVYKCVAFVQGQDQEVIQDLRVTGNPEQDNLEYEFTKALLNLTTESSRKIAFVAGFGGPASNPGFADSVDRIFSQLYGDLIEPTSLDLSAGEATIPEDVVALVLLNPTQPVTPRARFLIDQFVQRGGSVGWFQSATVPDEKIRQQMIGQLPPGQLPDIRRPVDVSGLNELFGAWGITHDANVVLDAQNGMTSLVLTNQGLAQLTNPAVFQINDIDRSLPFLTHLPPVVLPTPSSLTLDDQITSSPEIEASEALVSDEAATRRPDPPTARSYEALAELAGQGSTGAYVLAATLQGPLPSHYATNPLPEGVTEDQMHAGPAEPARILVIGSGDFFQPQRQIGFDQRLAGIGQQLLFASLEWLAQDSALSRVRDKKMPRFIGEVPEETKHNIQFINIAFVPACFAAIGAGMYFWRKRRRRELGERGGADTTAEV